VGGHNVAGMAPGGAGGFPVDANDLPPPQLGPETPRKRPAVATRRHVQAYESDPVYNTESSQESDDCDATDPTPPAPTRGKKGIVSSIPRNPAPLSYDAQLRKDVATSRHTREMTRNLRLSQEGELDPVALQGMVDAVSRYRPDAAGSTRAGNARMGNACMGNGSVGVPSVEVPPVDEEVVGPWLRYGDKPPATMTDGSPFRV
jgi:hypothetical protein